MGLDMLVGLRDIERIQTGSERSVVLESLERMEQDVGFSIDLGKLPAATSATIACGAKSGMQDAVVQGNGEG